MLCFNHVNKRYYSRVPKHVRDRMSNNCLKGLYRKIRAKAMPNGEWHRPLYTMDNELACHVAGYGNNITTILAPDMVPRGQAV